MFAYSIKPGQDQSGAYILYRSKVNLHVNSQVCKPEKTKLTGL
jgi:hypothetical protein